jgi:DNA-binding MarR family transcriptional regulator
MDHNLSKLELKSTLFAKSLNGDILQLLGQHFGGDTTINQLRIGHYIGLMSLYKGMPTSNKDIADALSIPRSTVSRIVADCIEKGWVIEQPHPEDGRKRLFLIAPEHPESDNFEKDFRRILNDVLQLFECGEIVAVDPVKDRFQRR